MKFFVLILGVSGVSIGLGNTSVEMGVAVFWTLFSALVIGLWRAATLMARINSQLSAGHERMDSHEERIGGVETATGKLVDRVSRIEGKVFG